MQKFLILSTGNLDRSTASLKAKQQKRALNSCIIVLHLKPCCTLGSVTAAYGSLGATNRELLANGGNNFMTVQLLGCTLRVLSGL